MTTVSTYAYVNPVVAVLAGIAFLGEQFTWREGVGAALVLGSVAITLRRSPGEHAAAWTVTCRAEPRSPTTDRGQASRARHMIRTV